MRVLLAAALRMSSPATDDGPPPAAYALDWRAPASCPSQEAIEALVAEMIEVDPDGEGTMEVTGVVTPIDEGGYALSLTTVVGDRAGTRELRAQQCEDLAQSLALGRRGDHGAGPG